MGSIKFIKDIVTKYRDNKSKENIKKERFAGRPKLEELFKKAFKDNGYTQTEIGDYLKLHYSTISRIVDNIKNSKNKT